MIEPKEFISNIYEHCGRFFTGVPDSLLKDLCAYIEDHAKEGEHFVSVNEGNAIALAAGYHLGTGKIPLVYMQNSGIGNAVNPLISLADSKVYQIQMILVIGWRGEPGIKDEPQHVKQGEITLSLLEAMGITYEVVDKDLNSTSEIITKLSTTAKELNAPVALVVKKGTFESYKLQNLSHDQSTFEREDAIKISAKLIEKDAVVLSTTGKISRELYEYRQSEKLDNADFLNVGSMGHLSQIAQGVALTNKNKPIYAFDGDGAALMHMGAMATIGKISSSNLNHFVFNNYAHDSVGGQPTVSSSCDLLKIADACGYKLTLSARNEAELEAAIEKIKETEGPTFLEVIVKKGSRSDLGRPKSSPSENKKSFMDSLHV